MNKDINEKIQWEKLISDRITFENDQKKDRTWNVITQYGRKNRRINLLKQMVLYCVCCKNYILPDQHNCNEIFVYECCAVCDSFVRNMKKHLCHFKPGPKWLPVHEW